MPAKKTSRKRTNSPKKTSATKSQAKKPAVKTRAKAKKEVTVEVQTTQTESTQKTAQATAAQQTTTKSEQQVSKARQKPQFVSLLKNPKAQNVLISVISGTISVCAVLWFAFGFIPMVYDQTEDAQRLSSSQASQERAEEREAEQAEIDALIEQENQQLSFIDQQVQLSTNFGEMRFDLLDENAPRAVENFIRLTSRGDYNDVAFHRLVKQPGFAILQGGDYEEESGFGGQSAFGEFFEDEIWEAEPEFDENGSVTNDPVFQGGDGYTQYNKERNFVTIPKGYVAMANSGPNTNGSQFFVVLEDTQLPASYTIFAKVLDDDFATLDAIFTQVETTTNDAGNAEDKPAEDILLISARIVE